MTPQEDRGNLPWRETRDLAVQSFLATLPFGGGVAHAWSGYTTAKRMQRIEEFLADLKADVGALAERVEPSDQQREELPQLLEEVLDRVERETREVKAAWLRAFMAGAWLDAEGWDLSERLFFLNILDGLSLPELFLLVAIERYGMRFADSHGDLPYDAQEATVLMRSDSVPFRLPCSVEWTGTYLERLAAAGLVHGICQVDTRSGQLPQPIHKSWHLTHDVGQEFLRCFAFAEDGPQFPAPWGSACTEG